MPVATCGAAVESHQTLIYFLRNSISSSEWHPAGFTQTFCLSGAYSVSLEQVEIQIGNSCAFTSFSFTCSS